MIRTLLIAALCIAPAMAQDTDVSKLAPGDHSWGEEIEKAKLFLWGKVTLVVIADSAGLDAKLMGAMSKSIRKSQGQAFSVIVADQDGKGTQKLMLAMQPHFDVGWQNWSLTDEPKHPKLDAKGYPHYLLFDHRGKLVSQGKADKTCVSNADKLLKAAPAIYCGHEPFKHHGRLAKGLQTTSGLVGKVSQLQSMMKGAQDEQLDEIERCYNAVSTWRDRQVKRLEHLKKYAPAEAIPHIDKIFNALLGTELEVKIEREDIRSDSDHPSAIPIGKAWARIRATYRKKIGKAKDAVARKKVIDPLAAKARKLSAPNPALPVSRAIDAWLEDIGAD